MDKIKDALYGEPEPVVRKPTPAVNPHRCAKHVEDLMGAIMNFEVEDQFSLVWKCMRSDKGHEPLRHSPPSVKPDHSV
ncbi:hypothetical protein BGZ70_005845 [Mortierella alpina]|uniref:Uncharacterized protein n=1 Tax=Mortierella alpina TaxID=64518 RepID=A0A9P6J8N2_MORAP|nr:hypothetical protein BGZ70_005845 [Mortierella alpina]